MQIRSAFSPRVRVALDFKGPGRTKQSFKDECDVNKIIKRFQVSGELPSGNMKSPIFGDVTGLDFRGMMDVIAAANESFAQLPAVLRKRFGNDPAEFVTFCTDPANAEEMVKLGLATGPTDVKPSEPPAAPAAPAAPVIVPAGGTPAA